MSKRNKTPAVKADPDVVQAALQMGVYQGYVQGLQQCVKNLRAQTEEWRKEADANTSKAGRVMRLKRLVEAQHVKAWCAKIDAIAAAVEVEHLRCQSRDLAVAKRKLECVLKGCSDD